MKLFESCFSKKRFHDLNSIFKCYAKHVSLSLCNMLIFPSRKRYEKRYKLLGLGIFLGGSDLLCLCHSGAFQQAGFIGDGAV